jgi:hypothetical protein
MFLSLQREVGGFIFGTGRGLGSPSQFYKRGAEHIELYAYRVEKEQRSRKMHRYVENDVSQ